MNTLAIDFAWRNSGWVVINEEEEILGKGLIVTKPRKKRKGEKNIILDIKHEKENYHLIQDSLIAILEKFLYHRIVAEVPYFSRKSSDAILIGMGWALLNGFSAKLITASQVKEVLLNNPRASKKEIADYVIRNGGISLAFDKDHIKDAYACYLAWKTSEFQFQPTS